MIKNRKPNVDILLESTRQHLKGDNLFFYAVFYVFCFVIFFNVKKTYLVSVKWLVRVCIDLVLKF